MTADVATRRFVTLAGMQVEVERRGAGQPLLLLHGEEAREPSAPFLDDLATSFDVIIPSPPGFGQSDRPLWLTRPHDLAFIMLDLIDTLGLDDVVVVGCSLGGWIAAEMATINDQSMSRLVLVAPYGIKLGGPTERDIADIWLMHPDKVDAFKWYDAAHAVRDYKAMSDQQLTAIARAAETTARFCWEPYMHNPKLRHRLHRIRTPTLLIWGEQDGIVAPMTYGKGYQALIPGAQLDIIPQAGHLPHIEQSERFVKVLRRFIG